MAFSVFEFPVGKLKKPLTGLQGCRAASHEPSRDGGLIPANRIWGKLAGTRQNRDLDRSTDGQEPVEGCIEGRGVLQHAEVADIGEDFELRPWNGFGHG